MFAIIFNLDLTSQYFFLQSGPDLLVFDIEGDFVKNFDKYGRSPGEHLGILGFAVTDSLVFIISNYLRKIFFYNFEGAFLKTVDVNISSGQPGILNDSLIAVHRRRGTFITYPDYWVAQIIQTEGDTVQTEYPDISKLISMADRWVARIINTEGDTVQTEYPDISKLISMADRLSLLVDNLISNANSYWYYNDTLFMS